jgi:hypothetical protein
MNSVTLDWLDLTVILAAFAACASMGLSGLADEQIRGC